MNLQNPTQILCAYLTTPKIFKCVVIGAGLFAFPMFSHAAEGNTATKLQQLVQSLFTPVEIISRAELTNIFRNSAFLCFIESENHQCAMAEVPTNFFTNGYEYVTMQLEGRDLVASTREVEWDGDRICDLPVISTYQTIVNNNSYDIGGDNQIIELNDTYNKSVNDAWKQERRINRTCYEFYRMDDASGRLLQLTFVNNKLSAPENFITLAPINSRSTIQLY